VPVSTAKDIFGLKVPQNQLVVMHPGSPGNFGAAPSVAEHKIGKAMRAAADDIDLARVSGINVDRGNLDLVNRWELNGISGSMYGITIAVRPNMGWF